MISGGLLLLFFTTLSDILIKSKTKADVAVVEAFLIVGLFMSCVFY